MWIIVPQSSPSALESEDLILESPWLWAGLERYVMWRSRLRAANSWQGAWKKGGWMRHLFGQILEPSMANLGVEKFLSSLQDIHAPLSASPAAGLRRKTQDISGPRSPVSSPRFSQGLLYSRMSPPTLGEDLIGFSPTLTAFGSMRNGVFTLHHRPAHLKKENESSLWPTPTARDHKDGTDPSLKVPTNCLLGRLAPRMTGHMYPQSSGLQLSPQFVTALMGFPSGWTDFAHWETPSVLPKQN